MSELTGLERKATSVAERRAAHEPLAEPLYRVHAETDEIRFEFALRLAAVKRPPAADPPAQMISPGFSLPVLEAGQALVFTSRIDCGRFDCTLSGSARAGNEHEARESVRALWHNLRIPLADAKSNYRFVPTVEPGTRPRYHWATQLEPAGLCVRARGTAGIGYTRNASSTCEAVLLAYPSIDRAVHLGSLVHTRGDLDRSFSVTISLTPVALREKDHRLVGSLVRGGAVVGRVRYAAGHMAEVQDPRLLELLQVELEQWRQTLVGLWVSCTVRSENALPATLLAAIGRDVFGAQPLIWNRPDESGSFSRQDASLDLRCVVNAHGALPPVLPAPDTLTQSGVPTIYPLPPANLPAAGLELGRVQDAGAGRKVYLEEGDRSTHCYVLGGTGTGKSTLIYNMVMHDIERGAGLCLIDPHGDLYQQVLDGIPQSRAKDVILIDAGDPERAVGINFFECSGAHPRIHANYVANEMIKIFDRLYDLKQTGGPMFEQYMRNAMLLVMENEYEGGTLIDVPLLFECPPYRRFLLRGCTNPYAVSFWTRQAETAGGDASLSNMAPYITSKLNQFTTNALLRPIVGQATSTIRFDRCMDQRRIVLVNLSKGLLGSLDSQLLGMLITGKIFAAALQRARKPAGKRVPFYLCIDEVQNLATDTMAQMAAEARKYGLYMSLANQNLAQVTSRHRQSSLMEALLGNVGTLLLFRLGAPDSHLLESYVNPEFDARFLQELPNHHVTARLMVDGRPTRPFVFETDPPRFCSTPETRRKVRAAVMRRKRAYTRAISNVEQELVQRRKSYLSEAKSSHNAEG